MVDINFYIKHLEGSVNLLGDNNCKKVNELLFITLILRYRLIL